MDHAYAISSDCQRVQLPTFYPDASHYIYHQPGSQLLYGQGVAEIRDMQHSGATPPENLRGLSGPAHAPQEQVVPQAVAQPTPQAVAPVVSQEVIAPPVQAEPTSTGGSVVERKPENHIFLLVLLGILLFLGLVVFMGRQ